MFLKGKIMSKILKFAGDLNKPVVKFVITKGWYLRLLQKKARKNSYYFRKLNSEEKKNIKNYWKKYGKNISSDWCAYFSYSSGIVDPKYIPESLYYGEILRALNSQDLGSGLSDKNIQSVLFDTIQPEVVAHKANGVFLDNPWGKIHIDQVIERSMDIGSVVIKAARGTYGGSGIQFWSTSDGKEMLEKALSSNDNLIIQRVAEQHPFLASIHPFSLNTLRVVTLLVDDVPEVLSVMLRMGKSKSKVDNYSAGGVICPVDRDGVLYPSAVQRDQSIAYNHPDGFVFKGQKVPHFSKVIEDAKRMHYKIPYYNMVSWDYSVNIDGDPMLIEGNYPGGQLDLHQLNIGPIFGSYTDRVLDYVYLKKKKL